MLEYSNNIDNQAQDGNEDDSEESKYDYFITLGQGV